MNNFEDVTNICVTFVKKKLVSLSKCYVSMSKINKKVWEIFEKIIRDLENFTFTLFLNLLFIILAEDSCSRLIGFFSNKKEYLHSFSKQRKKNLRTNNLL